MIRHLAIFAALAALSFPLCWLLVRYARPAAPASRHPLMAWHAGGTLHHASRAEWEAGAAEDRLATCADFLRRYCRERGLPLPPDADFRRKSAGLAEPVGKSLVSRPWIGGATDVAFYAQGTPGGPSESFVSVAYHFE